MANRKKEELHHLMKYYEQAYFTYDDPVPFKKFEVYPVTVKDYYKFYAAIGVMKMDKNSDIEGVAMSNLGYLIHMIENSENGRSLYNQFITMIEMVLKIKNGMKCPICGEFISNEEMFRKIDEIKRIENEEERNKEYEEYIKSVELCEKCTHERGEIVQREPMIQLGKKNKVPTLIIDGEKITKDEYDLLRNIILYYNIPDYDDEYINPELKAELEEVARLKNPNQVQPSLEKQMSCILSATGCYTYKTIQEISIRKLVMLLRTIDTRLHYFAYRQGELSGMVKFDKEIDHWIYSSDKKDKHDGIMSLDSFKDKMKNVT